MAQLIINLLHNKQLYLFELTEVRRRLITLWRRGEEKYMHEIKL